MSIEEFIDELGAKEELEATGKFTKELENDHEFDVMRSKLEKIDGAELDEDASIITEESESLRYRAGKYDISLLGDFLTDSYKLNIYVY